jgi:hypothetical protein
MLQTHRRQENQINNSRPCTRCQDRVGNIGGSVDLAQNYIKDEIKDVPYAPAVMAGISLVPPLKNPAAIDTANREGLNICHFADALLR